MDLNVALKRIIETGKVEFGSEKTVEHITNKSAKLVVVSSNCPKETKEKIVEYAKLAGVPVLSYSGTSLQLGEACGKPFLIASLTVLDSGNIPMGELKS